MLQRITALLAGILVMGYVGNCWASPERALGKWWRTSDDGAYYIVKEIGEKQETLSSYDLNGELMYRHTVDYEIKPLDNAWTFEFWNHQVILNKFATAEDKAAAKEEATEPPPERVKYLFKIQNDTWVEVFNLWTDAKEEPLLTVYQRLADDAKLPWEAEKKPAFHTIHPKAAMNYFLGDWQLTGKVGETQYTGRMTGEWALDHNAVINRFEFFATDGGASLMAVRMWDNAAKKIVDKHFTSWGVHRDASYTIELEGEFFKLVGVGIQTENDKKTAADVEIMVVDKDHFTWRVMPHDKSKPEMLEEYERVGAASR